MACGGLNGFFGNATGSTANTGIAAALLFADGVPFSNLEFIQFHPTTLRLKGKNLLISESARSEGGRLFVLQGGKPYYFMEDKYPELGNLMPRDIVSREECLLIKQGAQVYLDLRGLPEKTYETTLADIVSDCILFAGIDPEKEPIPVEPGIHYFMGGIQVDRFHRSPVKGLYAAGECACQYHGANRLGGNSLLGAIHGGKTAAEAVLCSEFSIPDGFSEEKPPVPLRYFRMEPLQAIMRAGMGLERSKAQLENALNAVEKVSVPDEIRLFSRAILLSAWNRTESRGSHFRSDYPECNPAMRKSSVVQFCDGEIRFSWEAKL
jgi:succinate dehydrogenase / fumarate reductase flavoprotein subunit